MKSAPASSLCMLLTTGMFPARWNITDYLHDRAQALTWRRSLPKLPAILATKPSNNNNK